MSTTITNGINYGNVTYPWVIAQSGTANYLVKTPAITFTVSFVSTRKYITQLSSYPYTTTYHNTGYFKVTSNYVLKFASKIILWANVVIAVINASANSSSWSSSSIDRTSTSGYPSPSAIVYLYYFTDYNYGNISNGSGINKVIYN